MARAVARPPLSYYLNLKYPILVYEDPDGGYVAEIPGLPGCFTQAETPDELMEMVADAKRAWIESAYEDGCEIPVPRTEGEYSGRFVVRAPATLHRRLAQAAAQEGVSLNQYVVQLLASRGDLDKVLRRLAGIEDRVASVEEALAHVGRPPATLSPLRMGADRAQEDKPRRKRASSSG